MTFSADIAGASQTTESVAIQFIPFVAEIVEALHSTTGQLQTLTSLPIQQIFMDDNHAKLSAADIAEVITGVFGIVLGAVGMVMAAAQGGDVLGLVSALQPIEYAFPSHTSLRGTDGADIQLNSHPPTPCFPSAR
jgi:hypothetical protein